MSRTPRVLTTPGSSRSPSQSQILMRDVEGCVPQNLRRPNERGEIVKGRSVLVLFGAAFLLIAIVIGFMPMNAGGVSYSPDDSAADTDGYVISPSVACGSVFFPKSPSDVVPRSAFFDCQQTRSNRLPWLTTFLLAGLILLPFGVGGIGGRTAGKWEVRRVPAVAASPGSTEIGAEPPQPPAP
jgi:hypothetical protein